MSKKNTKQVPSGDGEEPSTPPKVSTGCPEPVRSGSSSKPRPKALAKGKQLWIASMLFGSILLLFFIGVFVFAPPTLPQYKQRILGVSSALLAGLFGYFITGAIGVQISWDLSRIGLKEWHIEATGGAALFVVVLYWWFSPFAPVRVEELEKKVEAMEIEHQATRAKDLKNLFKRHNDRKALDEAIDIYTELVEQRGREDLSFDLAQCLDDRSSRFTWHEPPRTNQSPIFMVDLDVDEAKSIRDKNKAIAILTRLLTQRWDVAVAARLSDALECRSTFYYYRQRMLQAKEDLTRVVEILSKLVEANPKGELTPEALSKRMAWLAWLLATSPDPAVRDGGLAVEFAQKACHLTALKYRFGLESLAAAYAETGQFDQAIRYQERALMLPTRPESYHWDPKSAETLHRMALERGCRCLQSYKERKPFRME
jgi:tetratricopeptide (TPR) repeat protein